MVDLLWLALFTLLVPVLAEYGKFKTKLDKSMGYIIGAGLMFLLASGFETSLWSMASQWGTMGSQLFQFIGWLMLLVGAIWATVSLVQKK